MVELRTTKRTYVPYSQKDFFKLIQEYVNLQKKIGLKTLTTADILIRRFSDS